MSFFPDNHEPEQKNTNSDYLNFKQPGEYRIRIMSKPLLGHEGWSHESKPLRFRMGEDIDLKKLKDSPKEFYSFVVWDYQDSQFKVLTLTQWTIKEPIFRLAKDKDYGDPTGYDIKINRTGQGMDTEYAVTPTPPKEVNPSIAELYKGLKFDLDVLFDGGHPISEHPDYKSVELTESDLPF